MFSVHTAVDKFKNATITGHFGFVFEENSAREFMWLSPCHRFRKAPFSKKIFFSALKRKAGVFKFSFFEEPSRKAPLSWRISVNGSPKHRNKAAFQIPRRGVNLPEPPRWWRREMNIHTLPTNCSILKLIQFLYLSQTYLMRKESPPEIKSTNKRMWSLRVFLLFLSYSGKAFFLENDKEM